MKFFTIYKREIFSYLSSPTLYVVLTIWSLLSGYFFYTDLIYYNWTYRERNTGLVQGMWQFYFNDLRFILILILPLITMRLFAEERKSGTIELITTYPVRDGEIVGGKFLSSLTIFVIMLTTTLVYVVILGFIWGFQEILPVFVGYLGLLLLGSSLISAGMFISALTENQFIAALGTIGLFVFFWFLTWNEMIANERAIQILLWFSLFDRTINFFRGIIELKHLAYFVLFGCLFLYLVLQSLGSRKWSK
jgi:ABC-2 type transport system permease protein